MNNQSKKILIINKDGGSSYALSSMLAFWDYEIFSANSFLKGIDYCLQTPSPPFLIIVDIGKDSAIFRGFPAKFKSRITSNIPIIAYTAINSTSFYEITLESGYSDCLIKPVTPQELRQKIELYEAPIKVELNVPRQRYIREEAIIHTNLKIEILNKDGIEGHSQFPIDIGTIIKVDSKTLSSIGLEGTKLKVIDVQKITDKKTPSEYQYSIKCSFFDLTPNQAYKLISFLEPEDINQQEIT